MTVKKYTTAADIAAARATAPGKKTMEEKAADPKFDEVRKLLDEYHDFDETFDDMLATVYKADGPTSNRIVNEWFDEQLRLRLAVGYAFVKVTPNSVDKAPLVGIEFPERCSGYVRSQRKAK